MSSGQRNHNILIEECDPFDLVKSRFEYRKLCQRGNIQKEGFEKFLKLFKVKRWKRISEGNVISFTSDDFSGVKEDFWKNLGLRFEFSKKTEFDQFIDVCYKLTNYLPKTFPIIDKNSSKKSLLLECRELRHSEFIIKNTVHKLGDGWGHIIYCHKDNYQQIEKICNSISDEIEIRLLESRLTRDSYNNLLLDIHFWNEIDCEKVLIYQTDTLIFKKFNDDFLKWDYIGAPFSKANQEAILSHYGKIENFDFSELEIGNGGLSLRNVNVTKKILTEFKPDRNVSQYVNLDLTLVPEDVYYSLYFKFLGYCLPSLVEASLFSFEEEYYDSFGCHQPWISGINILSNKFLSNFSIDQNEFIVHVYVITWNNAKNLEYFISWYRDRFPKCSITVYDNMSTDETAEIARENNCEHILFDSNQRFNDLIHQEIKNNCWKNQVEPWVFVLDDDELLDISTNNLLLLEDDIIFFRGVERFENKYHAFCDMYNKPIAFRKDSVESMNFTVGCHYCEPIAKEELKINFFDYYLIHNKWQSLNHVSERNSLLISKVPNEFTEKGWNFHYLINNEKYFNDGMKIGVDYRRIEEAKTIKHNHYLITHKTDNLHLTSRITNSSICFLTSLSPSHKNYESQVSAINSWKKFGKIYSINSKKEIFKLKKVFPEVNFVLNDRDNESLTDYGKPYTYISSFFNLSRGLQFDYFCIINSDIIVDDSNNKWEKYLSNLDEESLTVSQRFNFNDSFEDGNIEIWGFDVFTLSRNLVDKFPYRCNFLMGQPWWDWWIQFYCIKNEIPIIINNSSIFYHRCHPIQWSKFNSEKFSKEFSDEFELDKEASMSSERARFIVEKIKNYAYLIDDINSI